MTTPPSKRSADRRRLADVGEFGAIELFRQLVVRHAHEDGLQLIIGIGDDAAVWRPGAESFTVATTDALVQDVHFSLEYMSWSDVGWKAMAVNVSDIAAMGGRPLAALVTAALPPQMKEDEALDLYRGLVECADEYGVQIVGGDTVSSPKAAFVSVALYGEATSTAQGAPILLRRDQAKVGDAIAVTGKLGASAAGLKLCQAGRETPSELRSAHLRPQPRVREGQVIVAAGVACGMDISDGLAGDLRKICEASQVRAIVHTEMVPIHEEVLRRLPSEALALALTGGEDYELLVCGPRAILQSLPVTIVGEIIPGSGISVVDVSGHEIEFTRPGYDAYLQLE